jgi:hypothetical protein
MEQLLNFNVGVVMLNTLESIVQFLSILLVGTVGIIVTSTIGYLTYELIDLFPVHSYMPWIGAYISSALVFGWYCIFVYAFMTSYRENYSDREN